MARIPLTYGEPPEVNNQEPGKSKVESRKNRTSDAQLKANAKYASRFKRINCRLTPELYEKVVATGESANAVIIKALEAYLKVERCYDIDKLLETDEE